MKILLKILSGVLALLGLLGAAEVVPFLSPDLGVLVTALAAGMFGVVQVVGDYLDNKKLDNSFKADGTIKKVLDFILKFFKK